MEASLPLPPLREMRERIVKDGGFTFFEGEFVNSGLVVGQAQGDFIVIQAVPPSESEILNAYLECGKNFGAWVRDTETVFDPIALYDDLTEALTDARANNQTHIFNLDTFEEIEVTEGNNNECGGTVEGGDKEMTEKLETRWTTEELVEWFTDYNTLHPQTGGAVAMRNAVEALAKASQTTAMCGHLDDVRTNKFRALIRNDDALNQVARMLWWNEPHALIRAWSERDDIVIAGRDL
tara:strand:+ start:1379 stop:2089 length:711 start_codon:yes stop_codon:yes gene_type:complete